MAGPGPANKELLHHNPKVRPVIPSMLMQPGKSGSAFTLMDLLISSPPFKGAFLTLTFMSNIKSQGLAGCKITYGTYTNIT